MASQNKIIEMIGAIKTIYSYYAKDTNIEMLVKTWTALLNSYDDAVVEMAFYQCLQTCKVPPTPADVIEAIKSMQKTVEKTDEELWLAYRDALVETSRQMHRFHETYIDLSGISSGTRARNKVDEVWNGLDDKIRRYLGSKGELMRNALEWRNGEIEYFKFEKPRFMKYMPIMEKRQEYSSLLLESGNAKLFLT